MKLRDQIAGTAQRARRSMNSEIVARLEQSLSGLPLDDAGAVAQRPVAFTYDLTYDEDRLIRLYRSMGARRRDALLVVMSDPY